VDALVRSLGLGDGEPIIDDPDAEVDPAADAGQPAPDISAERRAILERLSRGEIDAAAAAAELRGLAEG
jgi:hypothetical protein